MRFLLSSTTKDLKRRAADPMSLLIWVAVPALFGTLVSFLNDNGAAPTAQVLVADQDDSLVSKLILGFLQQDEINEVAAIEMVDAVTGRRRIGEGDGTALLVVPAGFGDALLNDEPVELELITNPAERILPDIVVAGVEAFGELAFYAQQVIGDELRSITAGIDDRMIEIGDRLESPAIELEFAVPGANGGATGTDSFDLAAFILPGVLFMSLLFIAQGLSEDFWTEKAAGTLRRAITVPQSLASFVGGKLLSGFALMLAVAIVALAFGVLIFDVPPARAVGAVLWSTYAGTALLCLFLLIAILCTSQRAASVTTTVVLFPLMMIGGSFLPFDVMPDWMRAIGTRTPNGIAVVQLRDLLSGSVNGFALAGAAATIGAVLAISLLFSVRRLRTFAAT